MTDWDKELAKIDKQLESISDEALFPTKQVAVTPPARGSKGAAPAAREPNAVAQQTTKTWGAFLRLALAVALGIGMLFWPYASRCGVGLYGYLGAVAAVIVGGVWSAVWTWRHRTAAAHVLSLLIILWGIVLGSQEILPRIGYAKPSPVHPANWACT